MSDASSFVPRSLTRDGRLPGSDDHNWPAEVEIALQRALEQALATMSRYGLCFEANGGDASDPDDRQLLQILIAGAAAVASRRDLPLHDREMLNSALKSVEIIALLRRLDLTGLSHEAARAMLLFAHLGELSGVHWLASTGAFDDALDRRLKRQEHRSGQARNAQQRTHYYPDAQAYCSTPEVRALPAESAADRLAATLLAAGHRGVPSHDYLTKLIRRWRREGIVPRRTRGEI